MVLAACVCASAGCGSRPVAVARRPAVPSPARLSGWRTIADPPGIAALAPDLSGLRVSKRFDAPALVRSGDALRSTTFVFASPHDAAEALARTRTAAYEALLVDELHGAIRRLAPAGYRLDVGRPAEPGRDTVEIVALRRSSRLGLVELVSAHGFPRAERERMLARVSR